MRAQNILVNHFSITVQYEKGNLAEVSYGLISAERHTLIKYDRRNKEVYVM